MLDQGTPMAAWDDDLLREPVSRRSTLVLSLPADGNHRHHKTRFVGEDVDGVWVEAPAHEEKLIQELVNGLTPVAVAYKSATAKFTFITSICEHKAEYRMREGETVEALLLHFPSEIKTVQLRAHVRVAVSADHEMAVRIWRMPPDASLRDRPSGEAEIPVRLVDVSVGGMGVICLPKNGKPMQLADRDRL